MSQLTACQKTKAVTLMENGWSARSVARELGVSHTCINNIRRKWNIEQTVERDRGTGMANKISTAAQDNALVQYVTQNPFTSSSEAAAATIFPGSSRTARRRLTAAGLHNHRAAVKEILLPRHLQDRLRFARNYLEEDHDFWHTVVFSDEKTFQSTASGQVKVYRPRNTRFDPRYINKTNQLPQSEADSSNGSRENIDENLAYKALMCPDGRLATRLD
ncbi:transposable element-related [Holotrichia oblita]|uniref:Transposable element-related n=1 Tax=Holotrichia oblita TaxID=644536 RepID=A0ACB9TD03_HOLOL|nr:transposable element-related [Holotrichia oblita]